MGTCDVDHIYHDIIEGRPPRPPIEKRPPNLPSKECLFISHQTMLKRRTNGEHSYAHVCDTVGSNDNSVNTTIVA